LALVVLGPLVAGAIVLLAVAMGAASSETTKQADHYVPLALPKAPSPPPLPPPTSPGPGSRLAIPSIDVNARLVVVSVDGSGEMGAPTDAWDVGWYDFSAPAGQPGNTVMSGHVDYHDIGPAVFWRLRELGPGDRAEVHRLDGSVVVYQVTQVESYEADSAPVWTIVGPTLDDALTLITCDGTFDPAASEYDRRLVVRGIRIGE
jgi:LPXTG-site transpeptidase (sortase) family protein